MAEMLLAPALPPDEIDSEREVVLEEIAMYEDEPQDRVHDVLAEAIYGDHPLGRRVLGRAEVIGSIPVPRDRRLPPTTATRRRTSSSPPPATSSTTRIVELAERLLSPPAANGDARDRRRRRRAEAPRFRFYEKETEQYHICFGGPGIARADERRFALGVLDAIFGGSVSSRLFREVREKRGLAYSVGSYTEQFVDRGTVAMYVGTRADNVAEACEIIGRELARLHDEGVSAEELRARQGARQGPDGARARGDRRADGADRARDPVRRAAALARRDARARSTRSTPTSSPSWRASSTTRPASRPPASAPTRSRFRAAAGHVSRQLDGASARR